MVRSGCSTNDIQPGCGIHVDGTGDHEDPYEISMDPASLAGDGLMAQGQDCKLSTKLVPGGGIEYDGDGAMYAADCVPSVDPSKPTVDSLLQNRAQNADITGGMLGGGYLYKPQSTKTSIEYGTHRGLDLMHLPVRMLADGTPVITPDPDMGRQNGNIADFGQPTRVQDQDPARWKRVVNTAGVWRPDTGDGPQPDPMDPYAGWFGYLEPNEQSLVTLDDAMDITDRKVPLVIEFQFPELLDQNGIPSWGQDAPSADQVTFFLAAVKRAIRRRGGERYVILTSQWPYLPPPQQGQPPLDVFASFQLPHTGPMLYEQKDLDRLAQAPGWNTWNWVIAHRLLPGDQLAQRNKHTLLFPITRHWDHQQLVPKAKAVGVLSGDPEYTAGVLKTHPAFGNFRTRKTASTFHFSTVEHGLVAPRDEWQTEVHPNRRGHMPRYLVDPVKPPNPDPRGQYDLGKDCAVDGQPQYYVLQGWLSPVPKLHPDDESGWSFDLNFWIKSGPQVQAEVLLCRKTDAPFDGFDKSQDKTGYIVSYRQDKLVLVAWDAGANATNDMASLDISKLAKDWIAVRVSVRDDGVTLAVCDRDSNQPLQDPAPYSSAQDQDPTKKRLGAKESGNRGGYVFFGRVNEAPGDQGGGQQPPPPDQGGQPPPPPDQGQPPPPAPQPPPPPQAETYVVQKGETLDQIAKKTHSDPKAIAQANNIQNPDKIQEGQVLKIPR